MTEPKGLEDYLARNERKANGGAEPVRFEVVEFDPPPVVVVEVPLTLEDTARFRALIDDAELVQQLEQGDEAKP